LPEVAKMKHIDILNLSAKNGMPARANLRQKRYQYWQIKCLQLRELSLMHTKVMIRTALDRNHTEEFGFLDISGIYIHDEKNQNMKVLAKPTCQDA